MNSSNPTPGEVQRALNETMRTYWVLFLVHGVIMMILGVLAVIWPQIIDRGRRCLCWLDVPAQRHRGVGHDVPRTEHTRVSVVFAHRGTLVDRRCPASLAPNPGRRLAYAGAYRLFHRRRNISDCRGDQVSRRAPWFMGMDGDERDRRLGPGLADYQRMAGHCELGNRIDRRCQPLHLGSGNHDGGARRAQPRQSGSKRNALTRTQKTFNAAGRN